MPRLTLKASLAWQELKPSRHQSFNPRFAAFFRPTITARTKKRQNLAARCPHGTESRKT
jgi:hypothetical protein